MTGPVDSMVMSANEATDVRSNLPGAGNFAGKQVPVMPGLAPITKTEDRIEPEDLTVSPLPRGADPWTT
jgi:hypothetical protein